MKLTETKLKQLTTLLNIMEDFSKSTENSVNAGNIRIVILQRGWVFIGRFYQCESQCELQNAYCIRRWGTTQGLGQLAYEGKQEETVLEKTPTVKFHELTIVATIDCEESKWAHLM